MSEKHQSLTASRFDAQAQAYVQSPVHAAGADLERLAQLLAASSPGRVLDIGCGGGHAAYAAAPHAGQVLACDIAPEMLAAVTAEAARRGLGNILTQQAAAESLPFADASFDWVISRYSAHHWPKVCVAMAEARRVLKPGGQGLFMDVVAPANPLLDTWLQSLELLRDPGHLRNRSLEQWRQALEGAGFMVQEVIEERIAIDFASWIARMKTPAPLVAAIRYLQGIMPDEVRRHFAFAADGSFELEVASIRVG